MTTIGLVRLLRRHVWLVAICVVAGAAAATGLSALMMTPSYAVTTKLYVTATGATANDKLQNGDYARTHVSSYTDMVTSNELLQAVRADLGAPPSRVGGYKDLADDISASNPLDTYIIDVTVQDSSAQQALSVAQAIGEVYDSVVMRAENTGGGPSPVRVSVLSAPTLPTAPHSPGIALYAVGGLVLGLVVGAGGAWLVEFLPVLRGPSPAVDQVLPSSWSWDVDERMLPAHGDQDGEVVRPIRRGPARHQMPAPQDEQGAEGW